MDTSTQSSAARPASPRDIVDLLVLLLIVVVAVAASQTLGPTTGAGNAAAMLGVLSAFAWSLLAVRLRGESFGEIGIRRPESWWKTWLWAFAGLVVLLLVGGAIQTLVLPALLDQPAADTSRFDALRGNPAKLLQTLLVVWVTAALTEEVIYRGFLMSRLARLLGGTRNAWIGAAVLGSVLFGFIHLYQGIAGVVMTGIAGLIYGLLYLAVDRNVWPCVFAHGLTHAVSFTALAFGLVPG